MRQSIIFIIILLVFSSCVRRKNNFKTSQNTIVIWENDDAKVATFIDEICKRFKELPENKDISFRRVHYHTEDLTQQFQTASIAGSPPDLLMCPSDTAGVYSISGFILPVNHLLDLKKYNKSAIQAITTNGKTWGLPYTNGNHLMLYYNKSLIKTPPKTTDELFSVCSKVIKNKNLKYCLAMNLGEPYWFIPWLGAFGGWPINVNKPTLNTKSMIDTIKFLLDIKFQKKILPMECDYNCLDALFKEGRVPFVINGDWALSIYQNQMGKKFGVAIIPKLSKTNKYPTPMVSGKYFMFSSKLKDKKLELVTRFVKFYTNKENQLYQLRQLKRLPVLKEAAKASIIQNDPILKISMKQLFFGKPMPIATEMRAIWDAMRPHLGKAITKKESPEIAAMKMQKDAMSKIKEMNL